ncbi:MAG: alpha/beta fold hydrolase [Anaerolineales bacterium]
MTASQNESDRAGGHHIAISDTRLFVVERGQGFPVFVLHGGPGLDHHMFGDYLDPLGDLIRLIFVDQRSQGLSDPTPVETLTLAQMAEDIVSLAKAMSLDRYAVLGHSYGALVTLQNAVDFPGKASFSIVSSGFPAVRFLAHVEHNLKIFEPEDLRDQVAASWARETSVETPEDVASLMHDQQPFHFANPLDKRIKEYERRTSGAVYSPGVLRYFASQEYGGIEVEDRLGLVTQPLLVLAGRYDRACSVEASQAIANGIPHAELIVFENSAHMSFVEENERYLSIVRDFLNRQLLDE